MSDREYVYVERWRESEDGAVIRVSRLATEHAEAVAGPGRVALRAMCAQAMRQEGADTVWDLSLEFNVGGSVSKNR